MGYRCGRYKLQHGVILDPGSFLPTCSNLLIPTLSSLVSPGESVFFLALALDDHSGVGKLAGWVKRPLNSSLGEGVVVG